MIFGIGTDIIEVHRMKRELEKDIGFRESIFTKEEIDYCDSMKSFAQNYAARFAAKEAFFKAIGTGWQGGLTFKDIEILRDELGKPEIRLSGKTKDYCDQKGLRNFQVSLSHIKEYAVAFITIET